MLLKAIPKPKLNVQLRRITDLQSYFNPFMTEAVIIQKPVHCNQGKSMDWFLYDNGLRHEWVKSLVGIRLLLIIYLMHQVYMVIKRKSETGILLKMYIVKITHLALVRSSYPEEFCKKGVLRSFSKFTGKHLCQSLF